MHDGPTSEIDGFNRGIRIPKAVHETADSPDHVRHREVDHKHPTRHEDHERGVFRSFGDGTNDQGGRDHGEHHLIHCVDVL